MKTRHTYTVVAFREAVLRHTHKRLRINSCTVSSTADRRFMLPSFTFKNVIQGTFPARRIRRKG